MRQQDVVRRALEQTPVSPPALPDVQLSPAALPKVRTQAPKVPSTKGGGRVSDRGVSSLDLLSPEVLRGRAENRRIDIAKLAEKHVQNTAVLPSDSEAFLFLSLSIPDNKLKKLIESATEAGIAVVFRGGVDENDLSTIKLIKRLRGLRLKKIGELQINPPLFSRFEVTQAPTYVVAKIPDSLKEENGTAPYGSYAKISGDILPGYALQEFVSRGAEGIPPIAERYLDKWRRGL